MKDNKQKTKAPKKKSAFLRALNGVMPYILTVIAAVIIFSLTVLTGSVGASIRGGLYGTFSNFATYFVPIFLLYHAIMWNYDVKCGCCIRRVVCSVATLICFSTMQYLIHVVDHASLNSYNVGVFFDLGKESVGGGVVGGMAGKLLLNLGTIAGVIIITLALVFLILQMFNITPAYMWRSMFKGKKKKKPQPQQRPVQRKPVSHHPRPKKEEEIFDEDIPHAYKDTTVVTNTDEVTYDDEEEYSSYNELDVNEINAKTEHIPSQLQPYADSGDFDFDPKDYDFSVSSTKYEPIDEQEEPYEPYEPYKPHEEPKKQEKSVNEPPKFDGFDDFDDFFDFDKPKEEKQPPVSAPIKKEEPKEEAPRPREISPVEEDDDLYWFDAEPIEEEKPQKSYIPDNVLKEAMTAPKKPVFAAPVQEKPKEKKPEPPKKEAKPKIDYKLPPIYFLQSHPDNSNSEDVKQELQENAKIIVETLADFKAHSNVVKVTRGPTITRYELQPEKGVRVRTIEGLVDDIALNLAAKGIRMECPIPGKNAIGIEVPNRTVSFVYLRDLIEDPRFGAAESKLTCALGKSIAGENIYVDIESTPHLLVAGATGMGKSVCINSLLVSLLYKATPEDVRLILIDPKRVELSNYNGIPHLLVPVVCEPKKSLGALQWAVTEMENRFMAIEEAGVRNIKEFNQRVEKGYEAEKMSRIVIVIDELADLKMAVPDIEGHITRLTQKARAAGIHIIIGTQRPSVDVLTGLIKNNIPSRIAFRVPSQVDSRTILDEVGADKLVSKGDMLVKLVGALNPVRVQGAYVSVDEIQDVIDYWKAAGPANYDEEVIKQIDNNAAKLAKNDKDVGEGDDEDGEGVDPEFYNALDLAVDLGKISSSLLMRKLSLGFGRASRVIDQLEERGYIGEANGPKPRDVLISKEDFQEIMMRKNDE